MKELILSFIINHTLLTYAIILAIVCNLTSLVMKWYVIHEFSKYTYKVPIRLYIKYMFQITSIIIYSILGFNVLILFISFIFFNHFKAILMSYVLKDLIKQIKDNKDNKNIGETKDNEKQFEQYDN